MLYKNYIKGRNDTLDIDPERLLCICPEGAVQWKSRREGWMLSFIRSNCHINTRLLEAS